MKKGGKSEDDGSGISTPFNVSRGAHVTKDLNWETDDPEKVVALTTQLGKGCEAEIKLENAA